MARRIPRTLAAALASLLLLAGCDFDGAYDLPLPGSPVDADEAYQVTVSFDDVMNVVPRSPVKVDDVTVGEVREVERTGWDAELTLLVREDVVLPANVRAEIRQTSLLGEKYVSLESPEDPSPERLGDGDHIALAATGRNPEVEEVLGALSFLLSGGGVGQLGTITHELNQVMNGRTDDLQDLLGSLERVVGTVDGQKQDIIAALESMNDLAGTLNAERRVIGKSLDVMGPAVAVLSDQHAKLTEMLTALDELGVVGTRVLRASKDDVLAILEDLRPILRRLDEAGASLPAGLSLLLSFPFPEEAREIVKGDYANAEIRLEISLENFAGSPSVPEPGEVVDDLQKCLDSGDLTSKACAKFLNNLDLFEDLKAVCEGPAMQNNEVCQAVNELPDLVPDGDEGGLLDGLLGLPGIGGSSSSSRTPTTSDLFGGAL